MRTKKAEPHSKRANTIGLKIVIAKTQFPRKNTRMSDSVMFDKKHLEDKEEFPYFGTKVTTTGDFDNEINIRI